MEANGALGVWEMEPELNEQELRKSQEIDNALREDRVKAIQGSCSVVILSEMSESAEAARQQMAVAFAKAMKCSDVKDGVDLECTGTLATNGCQIKISSFLTSSKIKHSEIKLSTLDPTVVIYLVSPITKPGTTGAELALSLKKALGHLLFIGRTIGTLQDTAVCVALTNCNALRVELDRLEDDKDFHNQLRKFFLSINGSKSADVLLGIVEEFQTAAKSLDPTQVRCMIIEDSLTQGDTEAVSAETAQLLDVITGLQAERVRRVEETNLASSVHNVLTRTEESPEKAEKSGSEYNLFILAILGVLAALCAIFILDPFLNKST